MFYLLPSIVLDNYKYISIVVALHICRSSYGNSSPKIWSSASWGRVSGGNPGLYNNRGTVGDCRGGLWVSEINSLDNNNNNPRIINSKRALNFSCYLWIPPRTNTENQQRVPLQCRARQKSNECGGHRLVDWLDNLGWLATWTVMTPGLLRRFYLNAPWTRNLLDVIQKQ